MLPTFSEERRLMDLGMSHFDTEAEEYENQGQAIESK